MSGGSRLVSFVILSWNRRDDLAVSLEEVASHDYSPREVIVVDNASTDGTPAMVRQAFPSVHLIELPSNVGIEGLNRGILASQGSYVVLLDDDSYPQPGAVRKLVAAFERYPDLGIAAGKILRRNGTEDTAMGPWRGSRSGTEVPIFIGCGAGLRRSALDKAGLFDGRLFLYGNELELTARLLGAGYTVRYFPEAGFVHMRAVSNRTSTRVDYYGTRNLLFTIWRYFPSSDAVRLMGRIIFQSLGYRLVRGEFGRARAVASALIALPRLVRERSVARWTLSPRNRQRLLEYVELWYPPMGRTRLRRSPHAYLNETPPPPPRGDEESA